MQIGSSPPPAPFARFTAYAVVVVSELCRIGSDILEELPALGHENDKRGKGVGEASQNGIHTELKEVDYRSIIEPLPPDEKATQHSSARWKCWRAEVWGNRRHYHRNSPAPGVPRSTSVLVGDVKFSLVSLAVTGVSWRRYSNSVATNVPPRDSLQDKRRPLSGLQWPSLNWRGEVHGEHRYMHCTPELGKWRLRGKIKHGNCRYLLREWSTRSRVRKYLRDGAAKKLPRSPPCAALADPSSSFHSLPPPGRQIPPPNPPESVRVNYKSPTLAADYTIPASCVTRGRGGIVITLLSSHQGEPSSIPGRVAPGFSHVGIVPVDAADRWVFSGISRFPAFHHSGAAPYSPLFILIGSQDLDFNDHPNLSTPRQLNIYLSYSASRSVHDLLYRIRDVSNNPAKCIPSLPPLPPVFPPKSFIRVSLRQLSVFLDPVSLPPRDIRDPARGVFPRNFLFVGVKKFQS
ncbi:hypothetical protein PR048_007189 [Dryococelus australis]|uniref:Uncharacterized protein n=1 Tax=Dryococelus australis TaxID=614101 RepID=A0ABQ9IDI2_9NEOP|nr:hypothetical protein PR048_007189 [Dryococelus australis]